MENDKKFTKARIEPKLFYPNMCVKYNKSEFATKQGNLYLTRTMSQVGPPHNYGDNNYVIN